MKTTKLKIGGLYRLDSDCMDTDLWKKIPIGYTSIREIKKDEVFVLLEIYTKDSNIFNYRILTNDSLIGHIFPDEKFMKEVKNG